jgi:hypothetical protein
MKLRGILFLSLLPLWLAQSQTSIGKYAGEFLSLGVGGRALGMGSAYVALAGDVTAGYWNPAGLSRIRYPEVMLMHDEQFGSLVNHDYAAVALPFGPTASLGLSVIRLGVDNIPDTRNAGVDDNGNPVTDLERFSRIDPGRVTYFNAADWAFFFTYARSVSPEFSYGANVKLVRRSVGEHGATGVGFDVGASYTPVENMLLGVNLQDITTTFLAWDTGRNELISPTVKLGACYQFSAIGGRIIPAMEMDVRFENRQYASTFNFGPVSADILAGLEYQFRDLFALRIGYSDVKQLTLGAGIHLPKLNIDYSFAKFDGLYQLGNTHRISLMLTLESDQFKRPEE